LITMKHLRVVLAVVVSVSVLVSWSPVDQNTVKIVRDTFGTPHITAKTDYDAFFGAGWAQAEDHLEEMLINYKTSRGRASEVLGASYLELDKLASLLDNEWIFQIRYQEIPCEIREMCEGFTDGINEYMRIYPDRTPDWAKPVDPIDPLMLARTTELAWTFYILADNLDLPYFGSNEWAISPEKSETGNAFVQADPHLPIASPFKSALYHVKGETFEFQGPCAFGDPIPRMGQTRDICWALTSNSYNWRNYDLYWLELNKDNTKYKFDGKWKPLTIRKKILKLPDGTESEIISRFTHFGPIYKTEFGRFAIQISGWDVLTTLDQQLKMLKAKNTDEFISTMKMMHIPQWNYAFADYEGNIGYLFNALIPKRSWKKNDILDGTKSEFQWKSFVPFEKLPLEINPECGWVSNCNEPPWFSNTDTVIKSENHPEIYGRQTWRSMRAWHWLDNDEKFDREKLEEMVMDTTYHFKDDYISWLEENTKDSTDDPLVKLALNWDGKFDIDSKSAPYLYGFMLRSRWGEENIDVAKRLREVEDFYKKTYGKSDVTWGEVNRFRRGEFEFPLNAGPPFLAPLHYHTPTPAGNDFGSAFQMLMEMSDPPKAWIANPFSQSENPKSKHYVDGTKLWCEGKLRPAMMDGYEVEMEYELRVP
jgi:acyl-homoserine-lactone acylase